MQRSELKNMGRRVRAMVHGYFPHQRAKITRDKRYTMHGFPLHMPPFHSANVTQKTFDLVRAVLMHYLSEHVVTIDDIDRCVWLVGDFNVTVSYDMGIDATQRSCPAPTVSVEVVGKK